MPLHSYRCKSCGHEHDHLTAVYEVPPEWIPCPECGARATRVWKPVTHKWGKGGKP